MQRPTSSSRALDDRHHHAIDIMLQPQAKHSLKRKTEDATDLAVPDRSSVFRRETSPSRSAEKWIHSIPLIVFLCLFTLWWFSYPVILEMKEGEIIAVHRIETQKLLNDNHFVFTTLASDTPPNVLFPQIPTSNNETEAQPVSPSD
ncbi:hypothetical protein U1Q18_020932 [Sarracenia purpurea var. burkii]